MQGLIIDGNELEDGRALLDYGIKNGSALDLVLMQRGGMFHETSSRDGGYGDQEQSW